MRAFWRRLIVLLRMGAPPRLTLRLPVWMLRLSAREFAFQWTVVLAAALGVLALEGEPSGAVGTTLFALIAVLALVELRFAWLSWRSAAAVREALSDLPAEPDELRFPRSHLVLPALMLTSRRVRVERGIVYHREERRVVRLDAYRPAAAPEGPRPAVIQVHGGGWILGSRLEQGIPLLTHLAANGWIGFNIDYWLSPRATMPDHVIDVKRAVAWVRAHAGELGVDPQRIALTGGSAGGHLTALAALTADDRTMQPGFEEADTSVAAAVPFYGVYDFTDPERALMPGIRDWLLPKVVIKRDLATDRSAYEGASPTYRVRPDAPPFLVFHGDQDSLVPVGDARAFVARLSAVSRNPVRYVELPGAEHAFDIFPSLRTARVVEGIERFLRAVVEPPPEDPTAPPSEAAHIVSAA